MYKKTLPIALTIAVLIVASCAPAATPTIAPTPQPVKATLALDWVPNTNHTGFYVALDKGWYRDEGIDLDIQVPSDPAAAMKQVAFGHTEFGVSFEEQLTMARAEGVPVVSIAAIIQHNTSAFSSLRSANITSPKDFEGKRYGSYGLPLEQAVIKGMMECAGADVSKVEFIDVGFDAFPALVSGRVDFIWIFEGWDGVQAQLSGYDLTDIPLYGSCVPDYYTPLIMTGETTIQEKPDLVRRFMAATAKGYEYAIAHPAQSADILLKYTPESDPELIRRSQEFLSPEYQADTSQWGIQSAEVWNTFGDWMQKNNLLSGPFDPSKAFTNEFLP